MPIVKPKPFEPIPHMALQRAGFTLTTTDNGNAVDPCTVWERTYPDGVPWYQITRHDENKAPHRWSHLVDVWSFNYETGEWTRAAESISLPDAIRRFGVNSEAAR